MTERDEFLAAWKRFREIPFPSLESDDEALQDLRADLIEFDSYTAGLIDHIAGRSKPPHPVQEDAELGARIERRRADADLSVADDAARLAAFLAELNDLIGLAQRTPL